MSFPAGLSPLLTPPNSFDARPAVEWLVQHACEHAASDVHMRPTAQHVEVLWRRDGVLSHAFDLPTETYERLLVGLKNMGRLASYKHSIPQDGRMRLDDLEVRIATTPTHHGEKAVLRLLRPPSRSLELADLGFPAATLERLHRLIEQPQGLVLATGPAGSGKTTTLFAALRHLYGRHREQMRPAQDATLNVVTLEDPIECVVPEFTQTQIQDAAGMTFASGLRSLLRQDPDVILVGEIRDGETAEAAVQCSLTGHLVFSTVHARDSVGVIPRLREMGVAPYLLAASLCGVIYQRLLRRLCEKCRRDTGEASAPFEAAGCTTCGGTGYRGRFPAAEVLLADATLRQLILDAAPLGALRQCGFADSPDLWASAHAAIANGLTSLDEARRCCPR
jgi:general secretion pathway protein E